MDMNTAKSILNFDGYSVDSIRFVKKEIELKEGEVVDLDHSFSREIQCDQESKEYTVTLGIEIGTAKDSKMPFELTLEISGHFSIDANDLANSDILIKQNTVAILFPYLRALITNITSNANVSPIFLPTLNIAKLFEDNEKKPGVFSF